MSRPCRIRAAGTVNLYTPCMIQPDQEEVAVDIGKEKPGRIVTPLEEPVPQRERTSPAVVPQRAPVRKPVETPAPQRAPKRVPQKVGNLPIRQPSLLGRFEVTS